MTNEETNKVLEELYEVRPEKLNDKAKRLFEAIMKIADSRDKAEADLYEANNRINDLLDTIKLKEDQIEYVENEYGITIEEKDKIIDLMADKILEQDTLNQDDIDHYDNKHEVIKYFEERCK